MATEYNVGFTDAESVNNSPRSNFIYRDFSLFFTRNPVTSDVATVTDIQDIKRAVKNIVLLNPGEKPFHPEIGTGVRAALFQNFTPPLMQALRARIEFVLQKYEPRISVTVVEFGKGNTAAMMDQNELAIRINFVINNVPQQIEAVDITLQRVR